MILQAATRSRTKAWKGVGAARRAGRARMQPGQQPMFLVAVLSDLTGWATFVRGLEETVHRTGTSQRAPRRVRPPPRTGCVDME